MATYGNSEKSNNVNETFQLEKIVNIYIDCYLKGSHLLFIVIGIPLNLSVIGLIVGLKRLHLQRTFAWLGVAFSNVFLLLYLSFELLAVYWPSPEADSLIDGIRSLSFVALLFSNLISNLERHLCINYSKWYKRHITSCWKVLAGQVIAPLLVMFFIVTAGQPLFSEFQSQMLNLLDLKIDSSSVLITFAICFVIQLVLFIRSQWSFPPTRTDGSIELRTIRINPRSLEEGTATEEEQVGNENPFVMIGQERVSRLDVISARTAMIIGLVHLISFVPSIVAFAHVAECLQQHIPDETALNCNTSIQIFFYLRELVAIPCFSFSPIFFVYQSRDICTALRERGWRCCRLLSGNTSANICADNPRSADRKMIDNFPNIEEKGLDPLLEK